MGHAGLPGNERADAAAKNALGQAVIKSVYLGEVTGEGLGDVRDDADPGSRSTTFSFLGSQNAGYSGSRNSAWYLKGKHIRLKDNSRILRHNKAGTEMGVRGKAHRQAVKDLSKAAEKGSQWLWTRRKDLTWGSKCVMVDGSEPGTLGFTAEPSGGVVDLSAKHPGRRAPT
ncbi:hypothetical protein DNTS_028995 [Danionella cerebrum]|uniref:Uncharacterized protein n=1 Tax=Danionella cerebrum TaxID=2873325 RepID=A0A553QR74_9TELE|nr:hypothetical protein DNTS_028995 [Danionella translucida]